MRIQVHYKFTLIFIIISAFILFSVFIYFSNNLQEYTYNRIRSNVIKQIQLCKSYISDVPLNNIYSYDFDDIADKIGNDLGLRVTLIAVDGTVYGDSELEGEELYNVENHLNRHEVQQALNYGIGESKRFSTTIRKDFLYIATIFYKNNNKGIIRLSIPLSGIEYLLKRLNQILAFALLAAFVLSAIVSYFASSIITRPIREIAWAAKEVAHGNYSKKISISSNDEIGDLVAAFNYMSNQVKSRIDEVSENKSRLEAVFLSMFEGVMIVDVKGIILLMNQALKDFLTIEGNPVGKKPIEAIRNIQIQEMVDSTLMSKEGLISKEISTIIPDEKVLLIHAAPIKKDGNVEGAVLVFHDVTNLRMLEKIRKDFVANVSHELRTPISSIKGYTETLLEGALNDKENSKDFLKIILADTNRLANLIDDLLNLSKIESGKLTMNKKPSKLLPIIEVVVKSLKGQIHNKSIKVKVDISKSIPEVFIDEVRIKQVFLNLIDNAIKYNIPKGEILVSAEVIDKFVKVDISDSGIGIPYKDLSRLFERFYRVDKARSRELGGTGLGLSIVKRIIQAHGGEVSVKSIEGQGSTFSFTLPLVS